MSARLQAARSALLQWYYERSRDLPWRNTQDPYAIWVSELMCQQTRVDTVIPYYQRWMATLPTIERLANAPLDEVLLLWQGLGYYRRARYLHAGAQQVMTHHAGVIPADDAALRALPGIGDYTAGAIASIAYQREVPALDGNVLRVFSRVLREARPIDTSAGVRAIRAFAVEFVQGTRPGDVNQALMELGATLCTPHAAPCTQCPLQSICASAGKDDVLSFPFKKPKAAPREEHVHAWLIEDPQGRLLVTRRRDDQLLGGLWEIPLLDEAPQSPEFTHVGHERHVFSHILMSITLWRSYRDSASADDALPTHARYDAHCFADSATLATLPQSTLMRKILRLARQNA